MILIICMKHWNKNVIHLTWFVCWTAEQGSAQLIIVIVIIGICNNDTITIYRNYNIPVETCNYLNPFNDSQKWIELNWMHIFVIAGHCIVIQWVQCAFLCWTRQITKLSTLFFVFAKYLKNVPSTRSITLAYTVKSCSTLWLSQSFCVTVAWAHAQNWPCSMHPDEADVPHFNK